jgi:serine protease Do
MLKKPVVASLVLITIGIIIGVVIVSNFSGGVGEGWAGGGGVRLGAASPVAVPQGDVRSLNNTFVEIAKAATPSVVAITVTTRETKGQGGMPRDFFHFFGPDFRTPDPAPSQGSGSGVIISAEGHIATNNHVVEGAEEGGIEVVLSDRSRHKARLIGTDPTTDLAVIKIEASNLQVAALGNSENVQVGEWVLAIGNPLGLTSTVTAGIVSALGRNIRIIEDVYGIEDFIQTDAAINPGNSGGALVNLSGEVVGINTAIATTNARYQGYGFAVPVNLLKTVAADLIKEGKVRRGYIGVSIQAVDQTMASAIGLEKARGVFVQSLVEGGAGEEAGLKEADVILSIDGQDVNQPNELQRHIATRHPGDVVTLQVFRNGKTLEKKVTLKARAEDSAAVEASDTLRPNEDEDAESSVTKVESLGISLRSMTASDRKNYGVESGVVVSDVRQFGEAFNRQIAKGDVIVEADRKAVSSPAEIKRIIESRSPGDSVLLRLKRADGSSFYTAVQIPER